MGPPGGGTIGSGSLSGSGGSRVAADGSETWFYGAIVTRTIFGTTKFMTSVLQAYSARS